VQSSGTKTAILPIKKLLADRIVDNRKAHSETKLLQPHNPIRQGKAPTNTNIFDMLD
jgi:hypothetical protein